MTECIPQAGSLIHYKSSNGLEQYVLIALPSNRKKYQYSGIVLASDKMNIYNPGNILYVGTHSYFNKNSVLI